MDKVQISRFMDKKNRPVIKIIAKESCMVTLVNGFEMGPNSMMPGSSIQNVEKDIEKTEIYVDGELLKA